MKPANSIGFVGDQKAVTLAYDRLSGSLPAKLKYVSFMGYDLWLVFFDENGWATAAYRSDVNFHPGHGLREHQVIGSRAGVVIGSAERVISIPPQAMDEILKSARLPAQDGGIHPLKWENGNPVFQRAK